MRIIRASDCRVMPWKNGGGTTTEIAAHPPGASLDAFDWRISMAHVGADGPFSSFPGIDRTLSVLTGNGIALAFGDGETVRLERSSAPYPFPADRPVEGQLVNGPIDDLNVMTRRGRWQHRVERLTGPGPIELAVHGGLLMLSARSDGWTIAANEGLESLGTGDNAILEPGEAVTLASDHDDAEIFAIELWEGAAP
ncbi:HutD family protein [Bosea caraganae]|uniref:HutD family protein n=1 Tax=Bosea caraganae TaxID=2763117 RepID=A0A370L4J0_9HYPH|nr:HutD family protein [Bosea caraganae]RDJ22314.1 HutD family protein [Bosea caraganae]RDJ23752.1 HutD family protein [Bosea caraganae]